MHYWAWLIFIAFVVMSAFVVFNLLIAVICDSLQVLRTAEPSMMVELNSRGSPGDVAPPEGGEGAIAGEGREGSGEDVANEMAQLRQKVYEMHIIVDDLIVTQERMAGAICRLTAERKRKGGDGTEEVFCNAANYILESIIEDEEFETEKSACNEDIGETRKNATGRRSNEAEDIKKSE